jgi:deazaflavin-dependent oxidoreductase (nitroreductase family)
MNSGDDLRPPSSHWWHGPFRDIGGARAGAWIGARLLHHLDRLAFRFSQGNSSAGQFLGGIPVITLTTTGARSGLPRSVPLNELPDGPKFVLIASNWGQSFYPAWYYNLRANPSVTVTAAGQTGHYLALETEGDEREQCWRLAVSIYPGYAAYRRRLERPVPVILLTPQEV